MSESNNNPPAEDRVFTDENLAAELFWEKNRQNIFIALGVIVVVGIGVAWWAISLHNTKLAAKAFFAQATTPDAWREVVTKYPGTMPAADASFMLAEALRKEGKIDESTQIYQKFLSEYPKHPLVGGARLGIAENYSVQGNNSEALTALKAAQTTGGYAAPFAAILEGRILIREGKLAEAKDVFSKMAATYQGSQLVQLAVAQVEELELVLQAPAAK
jgi:predicted negative regulator of RcsB-dependent stress response